MILVAPDKKKGESRERRDRSHPVDTMLEALYYGMEVQIASGEIIAIEDMDDGTPCLCMAMTRQAGDVKESFWSRLDWSLLALAKEAEKLPDETLASLKSNLVFDKVLQRNKGKPK